MKHILHLLALFSVVSALPAGEKPIKHERPATEIEKPKSHQSGTSSSRTQGQKIIPHKEKLRRTASNMAHSASHRGGSSSGQKDAMQSKKKGKLVATDNTEQADWKGNSPGHRDNMQIIQPHNANIHHSSQAPALPPVQVRARPSAQTATDLSFGNVSDSERTVATTQSAFAFPASTGNLLELSRSDIAKLLNEQHGISLDHPRGRWVNKKSNGVEKPPAWYLPRAPEGLASTPLMESNPEALAFAPNKQQTDYTSNQYYDSGHQSSTFNPPQYGNDVSSIVPSPLTYGPTDFVADLMRPVQGGYESQYQQQSSNLPYNQLQQNYAGGANDMTYYQQEAIGAHTYVTDGYGTNTVPDTRCTPCRQAGYDYCVSSRQGRCNNCDHTNNLYYCDIELATQQAFARYQY